MAMEPSAPIDPRFTVDPEKGGLTAAQLAGMDELNGTVDRQLEEGRD